VRTKLGTVHFIPAIKRSELCREAIREEGLDSWLSVAKGEHQWDGGFIDFDQVSLTLARFLNERLYKSKKVLEHPLKVLYVCGLDHFNKCNYVVDLLDENELGFAVIYRLGADERHIERLAGRSARAHYIPLTDERSTLFDISSTGIRQQHANDSTNLEQLTYPSVCSYLKEKYLSK
jgi:nicotinic acid mononucleotide adenylyltransferase